MQEKKTNRWGYIDFIRVFAIVLVILLHCICDYYNNPANSATKSWYAFGFLNELCRTGVPLFFMISGYLLLRKEITDIKGFYKRRILKVCIPFLFYDIFYYIFLSYIHHTDASVVGFFKELFNTGSAYHLWFIYSILFLYLLMPFIQMILQKIDLRLTVLFLVLVVFHTTIKPFINTVADGTLYIFLAEDGFIGYLGYAVLGYLLGTYRLPVKAEKAIYAIGLVFLIGIPILSMYRIHSGGDFLFHGGYSLNHYVEAAAIYLFCKKHIRGECRFIGRLSSVTFGAYFSHVFFIEVLKLFNWNTTPTVKTLAFFSITLISCFLWGFVEKQATNLIGKGIDLLRRKAKRELQTAGKRK